MSSDNNIYNRSAELRQRAEEIAQKKMVPSPANLETMSSAEARRMLHDLSVHQIELEMQNEELLRAQTELEGMKERYFDLYDLAPVAYCTINEQGFILEANLTAATFLGLPRGALVNKPLHRFIFSEDQDTYYLLHNRLVATRQQQTDDIRVVKHDGTVFWAHLEATSKHEAGGNLVSRIVLSDAPERKRAEEVLQRSEIKYRTILENIEDGYYEASLKGTVTFCNGSMCQILAYPKNQLIGMHYTQFADAQYADKIYRSFNWVYKTGKPAKAVDWQVKRSDGTERFIEASVSLLKDSSDKPIGFTGIVRDITERKQAENEKITLQTRIQQTQKMEAIGQLAGGVAHDFNNMLGVILGHAELAQNYLAPNHPLFNHLTEIRKATQRSANLTRQLLTFARKQTILPKALDLNEAVDGMLKMLLRLIGEGIKLTWRPGDNLWPVKMDPSQIDQILVNLCVNSRDAIAGIGEITVETGNCILGEEHYAGHPGFVPGEYVRLAVRDNGCGMARETLTHIFEPFFTTKGIGEGTGLGLATVYGIIKQNNGFVYATSEPQKGTTLLVYLPRHESMTEQELVGATEPSATGGHETILLVEDEPSMLEIAQTMIKLLGYSVLIARTPSETIHLVEGFAGTIHLLVTDVIMPEMNGCDLANQLRVYQPDMKCLFISGYAADIITRQSTLDKGLSFLQKPFTQKELADKVRETLQGDGSRVV